ncbi:hypothetical protein sphantq_00975 [Sphingobium sp. AntQ-1]|uniref:hypothetical protein n=1 Tax=Sphingobium sp. AntQ-1 TaxID=2930091 RepID=UPI00234EC8E0|nr:hypothetical protein [Sphingobium sp. AntQ-1]WCP12575.1 hypothetical protein sphantq_00975 [Sphingobium sp. AntQ-1]
MVSVVRDISHVCGHQDSIRIAENSHEKVEKYALWLASKICKECYKLEGRETLNLAAEKLVGIPLPTLRGTDKQIGYATANLSYSAVGL